MVLPYLMLRATGFRDNYHEETLANPTCRACIAATESFPHRLLDREYFLWKSGVYQDEPDWSGLYSNTFLAKNRNPIYISSDSAYAITHTILYITDWGNRADRLDGAEVNRVVSTIDALLIHYFRVGNYDLIGELLLNRVCFENPFSRIASEVSTGFFEVWRAGECIPPTRTWNREAELSQSDKDEETVFTGCYHTTLVGVLYCIAALEWLQRRRKR